MEEETEKKDGEMVKMTWRRRTEKMKDREGGGREECVVGDEEEAE